jgi:hypothetical protein
MLFHAPVVSAAQPIWQSDPVLSTTPPILSKQQGIQRAVRTSGACPGIEQNRETYRMAGWALRLLYDEGHVCVSISVCKS